MKAVLLINRWLITLFALSSGVFKVAGAITRSGAADAWWETDNGVFAHLALGPTAVGIFGAVQALGGAALIPAASRPRAAWVVAGSNLVASVGLFAAGIQPFGAISLIFVAMAVVAGRKPAEPTHSPASS